jgi:hypothetical protein
MFSSAFARKAPHGEKTGVDVVKQGLVLKRGRIRKNWNIRYLELKGKKLAEVNNDGVIYAEASLSYFADARHCGSLDVAGMFMVLEDTKLILKHRTKRHFWLDFEGKNPDRREWVFALESCGVLNNTPHQSLRLEKGVHVSMASDSLDLSDPDSLIYQDISQHNETKIPDIRNRRIKSKSVLAIQCAFRCYRARKRVRRQRIHLEEEDKIRNRRMKRALAIQCTFRCYRARKRVRRQRIHLEEEDKEKDKNKGKELQELEDSITGLPDDWMKELIRIRPQTGRRGFLARREFAKRVEEFKKKEFHRNIAKLREKGFQKWVKPPNSVHWITMENKPEEKEKEPSFVADHELDLFKRTKRRNMLFRRPFNLRTIKISEQVLTYFSLGHQRQAYNLDESEIIELDKMLADSHDLAFQVLVKKNMNGSKLEDAEVLTFYISGSSPKGTYERTIKRLKFAAVAHPTDKDTSELMKMPKFVLMEIVNGGRRLISWTNNPREIVVRNRVQTKSFIQTVLISDPNATALMDGNLEVRPTGFAVHAGLKNRHQTKENVPISRDDLKSFLVSSGTYQLIVGIPCYDPDLKKEICRVAVERNMRAGYMFTIDDSTIVGYQTGRELKEEEAFVLGISSPSTTVQSLGTKQGGN